MPIAAHFETTAHGGEQVRAERRRLLLEAGGALPSGERAEVTIHNLSETGLLLETAGDLEIGEAIDLEIDDRGVSRAHVVWASGALYGCAFDEPLATSVLTAAQLRGAVQRKGAPAGPSPVPVQGAIGGESLGERIHRLRKLRGLTQGELASRLGVSKPTVWAWEQGRARPIEERIEAIAAALGVDSDELRVDRFTTGLAELVARCREQIASVLETTPDKVRIMIDL